MTDKRHLGIHSAVISILRDTEPTSISSKIIEEVKGIGFNISKGIEFTIKYADKTVCFIVTEDTTPTDVRKYVL
jgi:hypothetical protein